VDKARARPLAIGNTAAAPHPPSAAPVQPPALPADGVVDALRLSYTICDASGAGDIPRSSRSATDRPRWLASHLLEAGATSRRVQEFTISAPGENRMTIHDSGYKRLFSHPEMIRDLLLGFVHEPWIADLDFASLETYRGEFIDDRLQQRRNDVIWRPMPLT
jgi:hypothetical protein